MSFEFIAGLALGFILGIYGGFVTTRCSRFAELRDEALRIIQSIEFIQEADAVVISNTADVSKLLLIASALIRLGHQKAAIVIAEIRKDIDEMTMHSERGRLDSSAFEQNFLIWQTEVRKLVANKFALWSFSGKL